MAGAAGGYKAFAVGIAADSAPASQPAAEAWVVFDASYRVNVLHAYYIISLEARGPVLTFSNATLAGSGPSVVGPAWLDLAPCSVSAATRDGSAPLKTRGLFPSIEASGIKLYLEPPTYRWHQEVNCGGPAPLVNDTIVWWSLAHPEPTVNGYLITGFDAPSPDLASCVVALKHSKIPFAGGVETLSIYIVSTEDCLK